MQSSSIIIAWSQKLNAHEIPDETLSANPKLNFETFHMTSQSQLIALLRKRITLEVFLASALFLGPSATINNFFGCAFLMLSKECLVTSNLLYTRKTTGVFTLFWQLLELETKLFLPDHTFYRLFRMHSCLVLRFQGN